MICKMCSTGAEMQTRVLEIEEDESIPYGMKTKLNSMRRAGIRLHEYCKGCDCQHKPVERGKNVRQSETQTS